MSGFNFNDLRALRDKMGKALADTEINNCLLDTTKELGGRLYSGAVRNTIHRPKGTGTLKRGWKSQVNSVANNKCSVDVFNNVPYAIYVEKGHRTRNHKGWVEGQFMLERAENEVKKVMPHLVKSKINKLLKGGFK